MPKDVELYVSRSSLRERLVDLLERSKSIIEFLKRTEIDFVRGANNVGARAPGGLSPSFGVEEGRRNLRPLNLVLKKDAEIYVL